MYPGPVLHHIFEILDFSILYISHTPVVIETKISRVNVIAFSTSLGINHQDQPDTYTVAVKSDIDFKRRIISNEARFGFI